MTSTGTGGIWSITTHQTGDDFFFGRTMIEDTTSTHKMFLQGFYSKYIPPLQKSKQLMRAVPKVSANYLEALERWDTGAIQSLLTQGVVRPWFWTTLAFLLAVFAAVIAPSLTAHVRFEAVVQRPWDPQHLYAACLIAYSAVVFGSLILGILCLSRFSPSTLNWLLRFLVMFFNVTYPFTSIVGLFWVFIPPYVAVTASFPFNLNAIPTIVGSLVLRFVEFGAVARLQDASHLDEASIAMTQKMDKVTLPIKLRAILKGFTTSYNDRYYKHDNSWWTSFGTAGAIIWVRRWLLLLITVMLATAVGAVVHIIVLAFGGLPRLIEGSLPLAFSLLTSVHYLWLCYEPFRFVMKGSNVTLPPRFAEVAVTVFMLIGVALLSQINIW